MSHKTATEGKLQYDLDDAQDGVYLNLTKDLSWLNSRNHQHTDNDGHVIGYWVDLTFVSSKVSNWSLQTAPNTWKMRNSFRKFHAYRDHMFKEAGVSKSEMGRYGRTIRPYLEPDMVETEELGGIVVYTENNVLVPYGCTDANRRWTYSSLASNPGWLEQDSIADISGDTTMGLSDEWKLTICGSNEVDEQTTTGKVQSYLTAGMIHSYNLDRMEVVTPDADEVIVGPNNPLAALRFQGSAVGEVIDITEEQEMEAPPYDVDDDGDSIDIIINDLTRTNSDTLSINRLRNVFVPAGILRVNATTSIGVNEALVMVDVKGWSYCKDLE